jgi:tuftelin-interacting protein 11
MTEAQLQRLDAKLQHDTDTASILASEQKLLEQELEDRAAGAARLEALSQQLTALSGSGGAGGGAAAEDKVTAWGRLRVEYPEEYVMYGLATAALPSALPALEAALAGWSPLAAPRQGAAEFAAWRPLLEGAGARHAVLGGGGGGGEFGGGGGGGGGDDPYAAAIEELVLPPVRSARAGGAAGPRPSAARRPGARAPRRAPVPTSRA